MTPKTHQVTWSWIGVAWPGDDLSILGLVVGFGFLGLIGVPLCRAAASKAKGAQA